MAAGHHATVCHELRLYPDRFFNYTRLSPLQFDFLLERCQARLQKRLLASGDSPSSMAVAYRIGKSTVLEIVADTCSELWDVLPPLFLSIPSVEELKNIALDFWETWNFPLNCGPPQLYHENQSPYGQCSKECDFLPDFEETTPGQATGMPNPGTWRREAAGSLLSDVNLNFTRTCPKNAELA
ncbi:hypothetical protein B566_EDAN017263, partial [Ephemera danica]